MVEKESFKYFETVRVKESFLKYLEKKKNGKKKRKRWKILARGF